MNGRRLAGAATAETFLYPNRHRTLEKRLRLKNYSRSPRTLLAGLKAVLWRIRSRLRAIPTLAAQSDALLEGPPPAIVGVTV